MNDDRMPLFCDSVLAERIERVEAQLIATSSNAAHRRRPTPTASSSTSPGRVASYAEEGSPLNKVAGLGFGGVPNPAELHEIDGPSP